MSCGIVKCSACSREVHQNRDKYPGRGWYHCEDKTPICDGADVPYAEQDGSDIKGKWCGRDKMPKSW